jgi:hypothetical protein
VEPEEEASREKPKSTDKDTQGLKRKGRLQKAVEKVRETKGKPRTRIRVVPRAKGKKAKTKDLRVSTRKASLAEFKEWLGIVHYYLLPIESSLVGLQLALSFCLVSSRLKKSCVPNCTLLPSQIKGKGPREMFLVATRPIAKLEELTLPHVRLQDLLPMSLGPVPSQVHNFAQWTCSCRVCKVYGEGEEKRRESKLSSTATPAQEFVDTHHLTDMDLSEAKEKDWLSPQDCKVNEYASLPRITNAILAPFFQDFPQTWTSQAVEALSTVFRTFLQLKRATALPVPDQDVQGWMVEGANAVRDLIKLEAEGEWIVKQGWRSLVTIVCQPFAAQYLLMGYQWLDSFRVCLFLEILCFQHSDFWVRPDGSFPPSGFEKYGLHNMFIMNMALMRIYARYQSITIQMGPQKMEEEEEKQKKKASQDGKVKSETLVSKYSKGDERVMSILMRVGARQRIQKQEKGSLLVSQESTVSAEEAFQSLEEHWTAYIDMSESAIGNHFLKCETGDRWMNLQGEMTKFHWTVLHRSGECSSSSSSSCSSSSSSSSSPTKEEEKGQGRMES